MKTIIIMLALLLCVSCGKKSDSQSDASAPIDTSEQRSFSVIGHYQLSNDNNLAPDLIVFEFDGHEYLLFPRSGMIHSESCPCKSKEDQQ